MQLLITRAESGGTLAQAEEARFAAELDAYWRQMTDEEQQEIEHRLRQPMVKASEALAEEDAAVETGARVPPRRAA
jgi:hypothetical protein